MIALLFAISLTPRIGAAQQQDSARVGIKPPTTPAATTAQVRSPADTTPGPPMSPRRAFLTSLLLPGYAQTVFGRDHAAMLFTLIEIGSIGMARKAAQDLAEARSLAHDSVVATYKIDPTTGVAAIDPKTGLRSPTHISQAASPRIGSRRAEPTTRIGSRRSSSTTSSLVPTRTSPRISGISTRTFAPSHKGRR